MGRIDMDRTTGNTTEDMREGAQEGDRASTDQGSTDQGSADQGSADQGSVQPPRPRLSISQIADDLERQLGGDEEEAAARGRRGRRPLSDQARLAGSTDLPLRERVLEVLEISPIGAEKLAQAVGIKILALRPELREMEADGLIEHDGEHYGLGPMFVAANPVSPTAMQLVRGAFRQQVMAEGDIAIRTGLSGETIRRTMRWLAQQGEAEIRYIGIKPIYHWRGELAVNRSSSAGASPGTPAVTGRTGRQETTPVKQVPWYARPSKPE